MTEGWTVRPTSHPGTFQVRLGGEFYVHGYMGARNAHLIAAAEDLQIDPYGALADLRAAIKKSKAPPMNVGGRPDQ